MPISPPPYKLVCPKCGFSKYVIIKSDALSAADIFAMSKCCKKCSATMEKRELDFFDKIILSFKCYTKI